MEPLNEIVLGLGAGDGYSGDDLTNLQTALQHDEVPYLHDADPSHPVLELRIHGVGGAPATDNLETPSVLQVAGDAQAGFFRPWYPGGTGVGRRRVEAYCWGGLNYRASWSALWLMLLPFGLVNVAHWALPVSTNRSLTAASRALLRLLALTLTATFVATTAYVLGDLLAWQAAETGSLWSWLGWFTRLSIGVRLAIAMLAALVVVGGLWWLSLRTQGKYEMRESGRDAPDDPNWALSARSFWCGERPLVRQRMAHLTVSAATVLFVEVLPHSSVNWLRVTLMIVAGGLALVATITVLTSWTDRAASAGATVTRTDDTLNIVAWGSLALAALIACARIGWRPVRDDAAIPYDPELQVILLFVGLGLVLVLLAFVAAQRPWGQPDVMGKGFASVGVAALATLVSSIFGGTLIMTVTNVLARPTALKPSIEHAQVGSTVLTVPTTAFACGLAFAVTLLSVVGVGVVMLVIRSKIAHHLRTCNGDGTLAVVYTDRGADPAGVTDRAARKATATTWATSKLTDFAAGALFGVVVPTGITLLVYEICLLAKRSTAWVATTATYGTTAGVFVTGAFLLYLRSALTNSMKRKRFGFFWDVVTFWPRACHPFGPPSYAERSVPEVVARIRRIVGGSAGDAGDPAVAQQAAEVVVASLVPNLHETHSPVLLVGYSQGAPIATAVVSQLPPDVRGRVALLTLAAPIRRLYGRTFPAYFGTGQLKYVASQLDTGTHVRWRNLVRRSDYIGGWALVDLPADDPLVDREIYDPPVLWTDANPSPPPAHQHSDWFPDPQTRPFADELAAMFPGAGAATEKSPTSAAGASRGEAPVSTRDSHVRSS